MKCRRVGAPFVETLVVMLAEVQRRENSTYFQSNEAGIGGAWVRRRPLRRNADQDYRHGRNAATLPHQIEQIAFIVRDARRHFTFH